jgi:hypothetical protein
VSPVVGNTEKEAVTKDGGLMPGATAVAGAARLTAAWLAAA